MIDKTASKKYYFKVILLLLLLNIAILVLGIIPAYDELKYFHTHNHRLEQENQTLNHYLTLAREHIKSKSVSQTEIRKEIRQFQKKHTQVYFLNYLQRVQQNFPSINIKQVITKKQISKQFYKITATHTFKAIFSDVLLYLNKIEESSPDIILDYIKLEADSISSQVPNLSVQSKMSFYVKEL